MNRGSRAFRLLLSSVVVLSSGILLLRAVAAVDPHTMLRAVGGAGCFAPFALLPFAAAASLDAAGQRVLLRVLGRAVPFGRLLRIRIASEALHITAPAGFAVADSATAALLEARCNVPLSEGAVLLVARKWLVTRAHAGYIVLGASWGAGMLATASIRGLGGRWLPWGVCASALVPLSVSIALGLAFRGGPALARLHAGLAAVPWQALREYVERWRERAIAIDGDFERIGAARAATWSAAAAFLGCWLLESIDAAVILWLVGGPLNLSLAMSAEVATSLVRSLGNLAPAGLGVQEASYLTLFPALGLPADTAAAFVLLKRGKELVWIAIGYAMLAAMQRPDGRAGPVWKYNRSRRVAA